MDSMEWTDPPELERRGGEIFPGGAGDNGTIRDGDVVAAAATAASPRQDDGFSTATSSSSSDSRGAFHCAPRNLHPLEQATASDQQRSRDGTAAWVVAAGADAIGNSSSSGSGTPSTRRAAVEEDAAAAAAAGSRVSGGRGDFLCYECGLDFRSVKELQLHMVRKTAWSNQGLVGCRVSCLVDNREWHEGIVTQVRDWPSIPACLPALFVGLGREDRAGNRCVQRFRSGVSFVFSAASHVACIEPTE